jgi:membrane fusion protein (multidrug efflux system)
MEGSKTTLNERNGHSSAVLDKELIVDLETLEARTTDKSAPVDAPAETSVDKENTQQKKSRC